LDPVDSILVGITGNSGCGQSTAASFAGEFVRGVCSLDHVGHRLLRKRFVLQELEDAFERDDLCRMDHRELRAELAGMVFHDPELMKRLNMVLHPRMVEWARRSARRLSSVDGILVLEGALIFELGLEDLFDTVIVVRDTLERCAGRLSRRDGITEALAAGRWENQMSIAEKVSRGDRVVDNCGDLDYLRTQIVSIFTEIGNTPK